MLRYQCTSARIPTHIQQEADCVTIKRGRCAARRVKNKKKNRKKAFSDGGRSRKQSTEAAVFIDKEAKTAWHRFL
jgi:hypothetical protein